MYSLTIQIYKSLMPDKELIVKDYAHGLKLATLLSNLLPIAGKWTRHDSCQGVVHHFDYYADLFNEGSIILKKKEDGDINSGTIKE